MPVKVKVEGTDKAIRFLGDKNKRVTEQTKDAMKQIGFFMEGEVKMSVSGQRAEPRSVDTGRFLNSVKGESQDFMASISSNLDYSQFLEYGTSTRVPRGHFRNSLMRNEQKIRDTIAKTLSNI